MTTARKPTRSSGHEAQGDYAELVARLRADPSLRSSDAGRRLLRLLSFHGLPAEAWERIAAQVPSHRLDEIRTLADACAQTWTDFAALLADRSDTMRENRIDGA